MTSQPKVLYFDIETSPMIVPVFRLGKQRVDHSQILKREQVICISWAWNDSRVEHATFDLKKYDWNLKDDDADFVLIRDFCKLVTEADIAVAHNGSFFDIAKLKSRIVKYRLPPLAPVLIDDTYQKTKSIGFTSHKLDDLGDFLGYGNKLPHGHGMEWWIDVICGNTTTLAKMVRYCDKDVVRLRQIYKHVKPYISSSLNMSVFTGKPISCRECGSNRLEKRGCRRTTVGKFQRYQCKDCGAWTSDGTNLIKKSGSYTR
jgi:uncharacterized protein YprB with RNaseH-like and TPR domain